MARPGVPVQRSVRGGGWSVDSVFAAIGLLFALGLGAWWTGLAIADGAVGSTVIRSCLSIVGGMYYLVLYRIATGTKAIRQARTTAGQGGWC